VDRRLCSFGERLSVPRERISETAHRRTTANSVEEFLMAITQLTRFKSNNAEEMIKAAKEAKKLFEKHGAEWLRLSRFHSGEFTGQWLGAFTILQLGSLR
jgi:hypothetical protein